MPGSSPLSRSSFSPRVTHGRSGCGAPLPTTHPLDQYTLVAPGTNFTPNGNLIPPQGAAPNVARQAIRHLGVNSAGGCSVNERFSTLQLTNVAQQCACVSPSMTNGPFWRQSLTATTVCNSTLDTSPLCPFNYSPPAMTPPFPTLVAWSIGRWGPGQFPGLPGAGNQFFLAQGAADMLRPGGGACPPDSPLRSVYYGVENRWGSGPSARRVDLADNGQPVVGSTTTIPVVGAPGMATHVVFFY